jgi:hypothetical protein
MDTFRRLKLETPELIGGLKGELGIDKCISVSRLSLQEEDSGPPHSVLHNLATLARASGSF